MLNRKGKSNASSTPARIGICLQAFLFVMFSLLMTAGATAADLPINFKPNVGSSIWDLDNMGTCGYGQCSTQSGNGDPTPFTENIVYLNGDPYFHTIVGNPATGFAIEAYTRAGTSTLQGTAPNQEIPSAGGGFSLDGGGNLTSVIGDVNPTALNSVHQLLNSSNPLGDHNVSGTGGNAPDHSVFRMVMTSAKGDMSLEVSKPFLDKKPLISQTVQDGSMTSSFIADERGLTYSQDGTAAPVTNNLVLNDPSIPGAGSANFSMAKSQPKQSLVTAGRFTFTPGAGWNASGDPSLASDPSLGWDTSGSTFDFGTYNYIDPVGFQPLTFDWSTVFDYSQNAIACTTGSGANGFTRENSGSFGGSCFNKP